MMKTIAIIGSTGSIGNSAIKVYEKNKNKFKLICLAANTNKPKLLNQIRKYKPKFSFLIDKKKQKNSKILSIDQFLIKQKKKIDYVISGIAGFDALNINLRLLKISKNLLIANKETIICGGNIFIDLAQKNNCEIIPIDSEHYCINYFIKNFKKESQIDKIYLAASGGPFLFRDIKFNQDVKSVLNHPTWKMGKKITVDSSTFANKVLELFEAKILFDIKAKDIKMIVEQKSNVHTIIKLKNNLYFPIIHNPNMQIAISNSLGVLNNFKISIDGMSLNFLKPNFSKFPIIKLGFLILTKFGHSGMIIFTILNERLVKMFLNRNIKYGEISKILVKAFKNKKIIKKSNIKLSNINDVFCMIEYAKNIKL